MKLGKYIFGALSGLTFGLLFAPKKGEDLRDDIKKGSGTSKQEALSVLVEAFKQAGVEALDEAKKAADNKSVEAAIGSSKEAMKAYFSQIEKTGHDIAARAKEKLDELHHKADDASANFKNSAVKKAKRVSKSVISRSRKGVKAVKNKVADMMDKTEKKTPVKKSTAKKTAKKMKPKSGTSIKTTVKKISKKAK